MPKRPTRPERAERPERQEVARLLELEDAGYEPGEIAAILTAERYTTARGKPWTTERVYAASSRAARRRRRRRPRVPAADLLADSDPACWSWPVTDADRAAIAAGVMNLWQWQQGRCAICGWDAGRRGKLISDHDHETGLLRGRICRSCNVLEARRDNRLFRGWRARPAAAIVGLTRQYPVIRPRPAAAAPGGGQPASEVDRPALAGSGERQNRGQR